jgi:hypothetical protein
MSHTQLVKYRAKLFDQLKAAHWTEVEPDKDVKCDYNLNDLDYLFTHGKMLTRGNHIPYLRSKTKPWIETPRYAELVAQAKAKEEAEKAKAEATAEATTDEPVQAPTEAEVITTQPAQLVSEVHDATQPTAQENAKPAEHDEVEAETNRLSQNPATSASSARISKNRGIDRMACARAEAHRIAAAHPWL